MAFEKLHLTELHEYLAEAIIKYKRPLEIEIRDQTPEGFININIKESGNLFDKESMDFDLLGSECPGLSEHEEIKEFLGKTINTSSVYEFVDFLTVNSAGGSMVIYIVENTWKIKLLSINY